MAPTCLAIHSRCVNTRQPLAAVLAETYPWCADARGRPGAACSLAFGEAKLQQHSLDYDDLLLAWWHLMQHAAIAAAPARAL
jgi:DNA helicase-2/ATP-dependent DNA helicase PcrA